MSEDWQYNGLTGLAAVKAADAALNPAVPDPGQAVAGVVALLTQQVVSDIATSDARQVLLVSGEWYAIKRLAAQTPSGSSPPTATDQAIAAADICIDTLTLTTTLHTSDGTTWTAIETLATALIAATVLSQNSLSTWTAMRTQTVVPTGINAGTIQTARAQV